MIKNYFLDIITILKLMGLVLISLVSVISVVFCHTFSTWIVSLSLWDSSDLWGYSQSFSCKEANACPLTFNPPAEPGHRRRRVTRKKLKERKWGLVFWEQTVKFALHISRSITCFGFDICKSLNVHMNDQCNPVLSRDDECEERNIGYSSLPGWRISLPGYRQRNRRRLKERKGE